jgi:protein involved in polysaccharide export with SLBB domain
LVDHNVTGLIIRTGAELAISLLRIVLLTALLSLPQPAELALAQAPADVAAPQDKLQLKVLEWLPAKGEYREWTAVGGEYTISRDGTINVPFVGSVPTASRSLGTLAGEIADALQRGLSLPTRPEVSIEMISRAPIYVLGGVETPGKVEFSPGLTALQAIALAGGFYRGGGGSLRLERDTINADSDLREAREASARLQARIARLEAELKDGAEVAVDASQADAEALAPLLAEEQRLLEVRRQARESRLATLSSRRQLGVDQLKAIDEQAANLERQIALTRKQLDNIQALVDKGLTVATRELDLERALTDREARRLDLQIGRLSTALEINEAERDQADLITDLRTTVAADLQSARAELAQKNLEAERALALLREATIIAPEPLTDRAGNVTVSVRVFLTRTIGEHTSTMEIGADDPVRSGDTIQVHMNLDETRGAKQTTAVR